MKLYRIYGYVEIQADNVQEALGIFEDECIDEVMSVIDIEEVE